MPPPPPRSDDPEHVARTSAAAMLGRDAAFAALDIALVDVGPGRAAVRMVVGDDMLNGHGTCHGGFIFTLADTAFAVACNSYDDLTVAAAASIDFLRVAALGTELTATATERHRLGRTGIYDVVVNDADGALIATFRGRSHTVGGSITSPAS